VKVILYLTLSEFPKSIAIWTIPTLRSFVVRGSATCRW